MLALRTIASLTVAAALCPLGAATAAPALTAPVIHEVFTTLPCPAHPESTLAMESCQEHQILAADAKVDALSKAIFAKLADTAAKRRFVAAEKAWLAYRGAYCQSRSDVYEGGSAAVLVYGSCAVSLDDRHVSDLTAFRNALRAH